ncbi:Cna B-type domain-containing protein [Aerococcaceae bacterium DSM 111021]|nr:Cna B-type domain-containing protein [Aerococcaceae bacterium DSM 111021]
MNKKEVENRDESSTHWLRRMKQFVSLWSTIFILLQTTLPVIIAAESLNDNDVSMTETIDTPIISTEELEEAQVVEESVDNNQSSEPIAESEMPEEASTEEESVEPTYMDFKVSIVWQDQDDIDGVRPDSLTVYRLDNQINQGNSVTLSNDNNWTHTWYEIRDDVGYSVEALKLPSGYSSTIDNSHPAHIIITNYYTPKPKDSSSEVSKTEENASEESSDESDGGESDEEPDSDSETNTESTDTSDDSLEEAPDEELSEDETELEPSMVGPFNITPPNEDRAITYNFYLDGSNSTIFQTQIILDQESLVMPEVPSGQGNFIGWYVLENGQETSIAFGLPITVTEESPETVDVFAKFENKHHVQFLQQNIVIMTKVVDDGAIVDTSDVPVIEDIEDGLVFSHWSTTPGGPEYDLSQPVHDDLILHAVATARYKIEFNSDGGTSQLPIFVPEGDTIDFSSVNVIKEGYTFDHWALPNGDPFDSQTAIMHNYQLKAVWVPTLQEYTVVYWHENANDTGYSFKEALTETGNTGSVATFEQRTYTHYTYSHADQNVLVKGDSSTQLNVFYSRDTYRLRFRTGNNNNTSIVDVQVKHGASTQVHWDNAVVQQPNVNWYDISNNFTQIEAPIMPQRNLTLQSTTTGNRVATVNFVETGVNQIVKTVTFRVGNNTSFNGGREVVGFTWQYVTSPGQDSDIFTNSNNYTIRTYYDRNNYNIEFITNNPYDVGVINVNDIPYEQNLTGVNPQSYVLDETTITVDGIRYVFKGWWNNESLGGPIYPFTGNSMPAHNLIMYAKWEPENFTVINHFGDGVNSKGITVEPGEAVDQTQLEMIDNENEFVGWYWFVNGRYVTFDLSMPINQDGIEIYPEWIDNEVSILYDANGGSNPPVDNNTYKVGVKATTKSKESMTHDSRQFIGWNTKADGSGTSYIPSQIIELTANEIQSGFLTLYAQWSELNETTLTYDPNGAAGNPFIFDSLPNNSVQTVLGSTNADFSFVYDGYTFAGWMTGDGDSYAPGETIRVNNADPAGNVLYAQWIQQTEVTAQKVWVNGPQTRPTIWFQLYRQLSSGAREVVPNAEILALESGTTEVSWTNIDANHWLDGPYTFSVEEVDAQGNLFTPENYTSEVSGLTVTNTYFNDETMTLQGEKAWVDYDNRLGTRPIEIQVSLLQNGDVIETRTVSGVSNLWTFNFENLLRYDLNGEEYSYTLEEVAVPDYTTVIEGTRITNTYENTETRTIEGSKTWNDGDNQDGERPDTIIVNLLANNVPVDSQEVTAANDWSYSFSDLPVYADGFAITYTIAENYVPGYSSMVNGFDITNNRTPDEVSISVFKSWIDGNNQDGTRPESIQVQLTADGEPTGAPVILTGSDSWSYTWSNLPENNAGNPIDYSVVELNVPAGYISTVEDNDVGNLLITNSYTPEIVTINGVKSWDDADDQDGMRPDSVIIRLYADNLEVDSQIANELTDWAYSFEDLPVFAAGQRINYSVTEDNVPGYSTNISGFNVINTRTPDQTSVSVFKSWVDGNNQDGLRPENIQVQLVANGEDTGEPVTLVATGDWSYTWLGLPENDGGAPIDYTVRELNVPANYVSLVVDNNDGNLQIINTYTPETIAIEGVKSWNDADDQDGERPETVMIRLFANNVEVASQEVSGTDGWAYSFNNLPVFETGQRITYRVTEDHVPGYSSVVSGFNITNNRTPDEVSISVFKSWLDQGDQDGMRPESVQVQLLADGEASGDVVTLTSTGGWMHTWAGLPENQDGNPIGYSVEELNVPAGYTSMVTDNNDGNLLITNSHTPETRNISGMKYWDDVDDQDGLRPESVIIRLFADNVEVSSQNVTETDDWIYNFNNLPVFANGQAINYSVTEDSVPGYSSSVDGFDVFNQRTPGEVSINVFKSWLDNNNQDGLRPESIQVQLLADGEASGDVVTLTSTGDWMHTWAGLPENNNGTAIDYSVEELNVPTGYTSIVTDNNDGNLLITNSFTPEITEISGTKTWNDNEDQDGLRPESVIIRLFADNVEVSSQTAMESDGWSYSFTNMPVFNNGARIAYTITEDYIPGYSPVVNGFDITNNHTPDEVSISVFKSWLDSDNQDGLRPESIQVQLLADGEASGDVITLTSAGGWMHTWAGLPENQDGNPIDYSVEELNVPAGYTSIVTDNNDGNLLITNSFTPEITEISGTKTWNDNEDQDGLRPESVVIKLFGNNVEVARQVVTEAGGWSYNFNNLPVFANGQPINYTITEDYVPGYSSLIDGFDVFNNRTPDEVSISVFKSWLDSDNQDGLRPESIQVQLLADGEATGEPVTISSADGWTYTWAGLPENNNGTAIDYSVEELNVPAGYTSIVQDDDDGNLMIINSYIPETSTIEGTKTWNDQDNQDDIRPDSIRVNLFANNVEVASQVVTESDGWTYSFTNMPVFINGQRITYTIAEDYVPGYSPVVEGFDITNNHTPDEVSISVFKSWLDQGDQDGRRPESVQIQLLANGEAIGDPVTLTLAGNWAYTWAGLPENQDGSAIDYSAIELDVPEGYTSIVRDNDDGNLMITNSYIPETLVINGTKSWNDADNQDGLRPDQVTINLLANNIEVASQIVTEADDWSYSFTNMPAFAEGERITYSVTEDYVAGYSSEMDGYDVINSRTPDQVSISVFKSWLDQNNQDGLRPESIQVQLLADGEAIGEPVTLTSAEGWAHTWTGLAENNNGTPIEYSILELDVPEGYTSIVHDDSEGNLMITNSHTPETTQVEGSKTWNDQENQDGARPEAITIHLLADGIIVDTIVVTEADDWHYVFDNLPTHKDGERIVYTITENAVDGYSNSIDGFDIINTRTPDETSVTVTKSWLDRGNAEGHRPDSIDVQLLANGEVVGDPVTITEADNWTYVWSNLPQRFDGETIIYSVSELNLPVGYTSTINDSNHGNIILTNNYTIQSTTISGEKIWRDDFDNHFETRPESITVHLIRDGEVVDTQVVTPDSSGRWLYRFENVDRFDNDGNRYEYTVGEVAVPEYTTTYNGTTIINTYNVSHTVTIAGDKIWEDDNDKLNKRPDSITVNLIAYGQIIDTQIVTADASSNWKYYFADLPMYNNNGEGIQYTVAEVSVTGYSTTYVDGNIINTLIPDAPVAPEEEPPGEEIPPAEGSSDLPATGDVEVSWLLGMSVLLTGLIVVFSEGKWRRKEDGE